jgi:hypothetical protein
MIADGKKVFLNTAKTKFTLEQEKKTLRGAEV